MGDKRNSCDRCKNGHLCVFRQYLFDKGFWIVNDDKLHELWDIMLDAESNAVYPRDLLMDYVGKHCKHFEVRN